MALMMVSQNLTREQVEDPAVDVAFPASAINMMRGNLGQPPGGWPTALQQKILNGQPAFTTRPGALMKSANLSALRAELQAQFQDESISNEEFCGYLMYPKVFTAYYQRQQQYGPVHTWPTPVFFYGIQPGEEIAVDIDPGKTLEIQLRPSS